MKKSNKKNRLTRIVVVVGPVYLSGNTCREQYQLQCHTAHENGSR